MIVIEFGWMKYVDGGLWRWSEQGTEGSISVAETSKERADRPCGYQVTLVPILASRRRSELGIVGEQQESMGKV